MRSLSRRRASVRVAAAAAVVVLLSLLTPGLLIPGATPAAQASVADLDGVWACTVPDGFTYDQVAASAACGNTSSPRYHLRTPADDLYACTIPDGFTYDQVAGSAACGSSSAPRYHLRR
jgi:hypothetical protein